MSAPYPFSAVVGLDDLRLALLLNGVSPAVGGVLVRGEKGTAKSTIVRGLAALLPDVHVVEACPYSCEPGDPDPQCPAGPHADDAAEAQRPARLVELPVGASEDRLVGSLDLERALTEGVRAFEPGLLAAAHRGVLYVDEVNLLHDHLVDLLLDAAALGTNYVEREGVSVRHASRFILVGTMNPEEGELRPQLLDRFGLTVEVTATRDPAERADVVRRRLAYEADPDSFAKQWYDDDVELALRIEAARDQLPRVRLSDTALAQVTAVCASFDVDGLRADIVTAKTAMALAAWEGRADVTTDDVRRAALLALPHRRRRTPFEQPGLDEQQLDEALRDSASEQSSGGEGPDDDGPDGGPGSGAPDDVAGEAGGTGSTQSRPGGDQPAPGGEQSAEQPSAPVGATFRPVLLQAPGTGAGAFGRRSPAESDHGRLTGSRTPTGRLTRLHLTATLRAAAPHQIARGRTGTGLRLTRQDLHQSVLEGREGNVVLFVVDASGSMAARQRMSAVKGAVLSLLVDAYQRRDKVGLITFRGDAADLVLPPTSSVDAAAKRLADLRTGGRTPLSSGLLKAAEVLRVEHVRDARRRPLLVVVTDGRATSGGAQPVDAARAAAACIGSLGIAAVVVDAEQGQVRLGLAAELAQAMGALSLRLEELEAGAIAGTVRGLTGRSVA
ncbi:MAG TPA: putative cobaltochelatase [Mycobacteriales bacterium]|nr:putative cobaltochelatase [Mycobacteriales bacterium]